MVAEVKQWTASCQQCVCAKTGPEVRAPLMSITTSYPFEVVGVDYLSLGRPGGPVSLHSVDDRPVLEVCLRHTDERPSC